MSGSSSKLSDFRPEMDRAAEPRPRRPRSGAVIGAVLAVLASGGLAWWLSADDEPGELASTPAATAPNASPRTVAAARPDEAQVRRAYEEYQSVYAELGADGLVRFSQNCAKALAGDPRILDYCLAFDMYAAAAPGSAQAPWFRDAEARRLALTRDALPEPELAADRIVGLQRLMRRVSLGEAEGVAPAPIPFRVERPPRAAPAVKAGAPKPPPKPRRTPVAAVRPPQVRAPLPAPVEAAAMQPSGEPAAAPVASATPPPRNTAADRCREPGTRADRLVCADAALAVAHGRMQDAYDRAIAAGADPLEIDREQALWRRTRDAAGARRAALVRLYERRIRDLEARAQAPE